MPIHMRAISRETLDFRVIWTHTRNNPGLGIMPQRVRRYSFLDPSSLGRGMDGAVELARRERLERIVAGKQPAPREQYA
jgi:hypothetical protein